MTRFSLLASRFSLLASLLLLALMGCNDDFLFEESSPQESSTYNCIYQDCITGRNPLASSTGNLGKSAVPLAGLQRAFDAEFSNARDEYNFSQDGYPAWNLTQTIEINQDFTQYLVPVFSESTDRTGAIILFTHYLAHGVVDVNYVYRDRIKRYPAYETLAIASKLNSGLIRDYTREAMVYLFSILDEELFSGKKEDLLALLTAESRADFESKDCKVTVHYALYDCQDVYGGEGSERRLLYSACVQTGTRTEVVGIGVGCDGGRGGPIGTQGGPTGGPTTGGTIGGDGTIVINTDPNSSDNRCIEDGVDCEEEEEEEEEDRITLDTSLIRFPCAQDITFGFINGRESNVSDMINFLFGRNDNLNLTIRAGVVSNGDAGTHSADGTLPDAGIGISATFNGTVTLNQDYLGCSKDYIYATLLHESIHAYYSGLRVYLGSTLFNELYPLYAPLSSSNQDHHNFMATNYVNEITTLLMYRNPRLSRRHAENLAWEGLTNTPGFENLNLSEERLNEIGLTNMAARCDRDPNDLTSYRFESCSN